MTRPRELRFNAFNMTAPSHNWAGLWLHPRDASIDYNTLDYWTGYARTAERGLLDADFCSIEIVGERPRMVSYLGFSIWPKNWRA